jgi:hypothetical protein
VDFKFFMDGKVVLAALLDRQKKPHLLRAIVHIAGRPA